MPDKRTRLAVIIGSTRSGRFAPTVANWFADEARRRADLSVDVIDLATAGLPDVLPGDDWDLPQPVLGLGPWLDTADAFVVVTPEYNHSFPAPLKTAIDWFHAEWAAKPVGFVSYGGLGGGLRAVEQLRLVFAELHATTVRNSVSFHNYWEAFDADGRTDDPAAHGAAKGMLDQLVWWSDALRAHRGRVPYAVGD
ncbi:NAD(P)H-dependent FMN reductase [Pseudonocardia ammonioxydans]|uniref:NAD(P)H-dependent FMN reductase n=1 Tax=Pseudonocardia ammonioxydans TaxID=260086 RepID=A0A1I4VMY0_PSUAM|nr:NAD(P)H-dependent oxidoreductase [Pseudonocardia ammonioxydans]SFN02612.1 NAD(P)H-dependent FMN reductase [Pseudonocardia ammonioxydans]